MLGKYFVFVAKKTSRCDQGRAGRTEPGTPDAIFLRMLEAGNVAEGDDGGGHGDRGEGVQRRGRHREVQRLPPGDGEISAR